MILTNPLLQVVRKGDPNYRKGLFVLRSPLRCAWVEHNCVIVIPTGTYTDFASIPRPFRAVIGVNGPHRLPAVVHDYLYGQAGELPVLGVTYTRKDADQLFSRCMHAEGTDWATRAMMYRAVRVFGGAHRKITGGRTWATK